MAGVQFKQWALEYVLSDEETAQLELARKAAREIESSHANSTVVGNWAASIQQWMSPAHDDDQLDDIQASGGGNIITRAKGAYSMMLNRQPEYDFSSDSLGTIFTALSFLSSTLEALDKGTLKSDQVQRLIGFFGSMFSYDHKAGITAASKALRQLSAMKGFKPPMGVKILEDVCKIKEDFRLQTALTRLEVYELFLRLLQDSAVASELQHKYGSSAGFILDLLELCANERDPRNLMTWFKTITVLLKDYDLSPEVAEEIFKTFSAYFPISLRNTTTQIAITADDLKEAIRSCFAAHHCISSFVFPFLLQKLDQGDAVTVAVKLDILKTMRACVESYGNPQISLAPYVEKLWNSLKYEVRNGDVKETIDATLDVLRAIAKRLDGTSGQKLNVSLLTDYVDLVIRDCRDDLSKPSYTKQAGLLLITVICATVRGYLLYNASFIDFLRQNIRQPKSPSHTDDLLLLLNSFLKSRMELVVQRGEKYREDQESLNCEAHTHLKSLFHDIYLPIWSKRAAEPTSEEGDVLKKVAEGLARLATQQVVQPTGDIVLLNSPPVCSEICSLLTEELIKGLDMNPDDSKSDDHTLEDQVVLALRTIVMVYRDGYAELVARAVAEIRKRDWANPSHHSLNSLRDLLSRLSFIGCSKIPAHIAMTTPSKKPYSPLQHFVTFVASLLDLFPLTRQAHEECLANAHIVSSLHAGLLWFRDACDEKYGNAVFTWGSTNQINLKEIPDDFFTAVHRGDVTLVSLSESSPSVYHEFVKLGLFLVVHLYRSATLGPRELWSERALVQVSQMAALITRMLSIDEQVSLNLAHEAFNFFRRPNDEAVEKNLSYVSSGLLTLGILQGLRPEAMTELYALGGVAEQFMCDACDLMQHQQKASDIRGAICTVLANKFKPGPSFSNSESLTLNQTFDFWAEWIKNATSLEKGISSESFEVILPIALGVITGSIARQDKHVLDLVPILHQAISNKHANGEILAKSMGILFKPNNLLSPEYHAILKRFYRQWAYFSITKPLFALAQPAAADGHSASRYRIAIIFMVANCPFTIYQDDLDSLIPLLITSLTGGSNSNSFTGKDVVFTQAFAALQILTEILGNGPDALKSHLREIINGAKMIYSKCCGNVGDENLAATRTRCRKLALHVLGMIPLKFEERHIIAYAPPTQRMLAVACGDAVRKVREVARQARASWAKVA